MGYGEVASLASEMEVPKEVELKDISEFKIIGTSRKNVDNEKIITGKPLFGIDYFEEGTLTAMIIHPPAFGKKLNVGATAFTAADTVALGAAGFGTFTAEQMSPGDVPLRLFNEIPTILLIIIIFTVVFNFI